MVLGILLYEAVEMAYNVSKIGYNSVTGIYNWYYQIPSEDIQEQEKLIKELRLLEDRLKSLENKIIDVEFKHDISNNMQIID